MALRLILAGLMAGLLAINVSAPDAKAAGWNDFHVRLDDDYGLAYVNSIDVTITEINPGLVPLSGRLLIFRHDWPELGLGPLAKLYWNDQCILALHYGISQDSGSSTQVNTNVFHRFVVARPSATVLGPFDESEYESMVADCNAPRDVPWMSVRDAYRLSFRAFPEQRFERAHIHKALFRALLACISMIVLFLPVGLILSLVLYIMRRVRRRRWPILRYALGIWLAPPLLLSALLAINGVFVFW